jgi:hypothetical protein
MNLRTLLRKPTEKTGMEFAGFLMSRFEIVFRGIAYICGSIRFQVVSKRRAPGSIKQRFQMRIASDAQSKLLAICPPERINARAGDTLRFLVSLLRHLILSRF